MNTQAKVYNTELIPPGVHTSSVTMTGKKDKSPIRSFSLDASKSDDKSRPSHSGGKSNKKNTNWKGSLGKVRRLKDSKELKGKGNIYDQSSMYLFAIPK